MKNIIQYSLVVFFVVLSHNAISQNVEFSRAEFPDDRRELRKAQRNISRGDDLFEKGGLKYRRALEHYLEAHNFNPNNAELNYKIGVCYLNSIHNYRAIDYFENAIKLDFPTLDVHYDLGRAYHLNYKFEKAIDQYVHYKQNLSSDELREQRQKLRKRIDECNNGKKFLDSPERVFVDNIGGTINSEYDDYRPVINADGTKMFFTSRRPIGISPVLDEYEYKYFENIYKTKRINHNKWEAPQELGRPINREYHDASSGLSHDGKTLFIYRDDGEDLYISEWDEDRLVGDPRWTRPRKLDNINSDYRETSAALSPDGNTLYFVSDREGSYGGSDIWYSERDRRGNWGEPQNIGPVINTEYNEESVFMHPDGKTLYFSSEGHNSMGGYDIFKTEKVGDRWAEPENMGYPINTPGDDLFFVINKEGHTAYYSSYREDGYGSSDIYMITILGPEKPFVNTPERKLFAIIDEEDLMIADEADILVTILRGRVIDKENKEPLLARMRIYDNVTEELIHEFHTDEETGEFIISLTEPLNYGLSFEAEDYLFHSKNINVTEDIHGDEIELGDIELQRIEVGISVVLNNIFFDFDDYTLRPESYVELGILYDLLTDHPDIRIEISGHTDNVGSYEYNKQLSENRARSVVEFLVERGIDTDRLVYKGYSFSRPIASNETEEGRQLNRRTEFEIIE